jgi:hypothetical protein
VRAPPALTYAPRAAVRALPLPGAPPRQACAPLIFVCALTSLLCAPYISFIEIHLTFAHAMSAYSINGGVKCKIESGHVILFLYEPVKYLMDMSDRPSVTSLYDRFSPLSVMYDNPVNGLKRELGTPRLFWSFLGLS